MKKDENNNNITYHLGDEGKLMELARRARGDRTLEEMGSLVGTSGANYWNIEGGIVKRPRTKLLSAIAENSQDPEVTYELLVSATESAERKSTHQRILDEVGKFEATASMILLDRGYNTRKLERVSYPITETMGFVPDMCFEIVKEGIESRINLNWIIDLQGDSIPRRRNHTRNVLGDCLRFQAAVLRSGNRIGQLVFFTTDIATYEMILEDFQELPLEAEISIALISHRDWKILAQEPISKAIRRRNEIVKI